MGDDFISIKDLSKSFKGKDFKINILKDINFKIARGETLAVVGESGIGKSTLLHIIGTLERPDKGSILFDGRDIFLFDETKLAHFRNKSIGFVFQFHNLLAEFTALENTMIPALINGISRQDAANKAEQMLVKVGLKDRLNNRAGELSGGEQQRVALARSILLKPEILLADEPSGNLDKKNSEQIHSLIFELNKELKMTIVIVTHNIELAMYMKKSVTIIDGKLVETD